jgi:hypothetical protein
LVGLTLAAAMIAGLVMLAMRDRRAALILGVWLLQPVLLLAVLTASSDDFAPERHLSFLIPAFTAALATFLVEIGRRLGRWGPWIAVALTVAMVTPGVVALSDDIGNFTPDLREASLYLGSGFGDGDVLLSTGGVPETGVDARLYGAYAALEAPDSDPLSRWRDVGKDTGCDLAARLDQVPKPQAAWVLLRSPDPQGLSARLDALGFDSLRTFGPFVVGRAMVPRETTPAVLTAGLGAYRAGASLSPEIPDFHHLASVYRLARVDARHPQLCADTNAVD